MFEKMNPITSEMLEEMFRRAQAKKAGQNPNQEEVRMSEKKPLLVVSLTPEGGLKVLGKFDTGGKPVWAAIRELKEKGWMVIWPRFSRTNSIRAAVRALKCAAALREGIVEVKPANITYVKSAPWWTSAGYLRITGRGWMPKQPNHPKAQDSDKGWVIPDEIPPSHWRNVQLVAGMFEYMASGKPVLFIVTEGMLAWLQREKELLDMELEAHLGGARQDREARREMRRAAAAAFVEAMTRKNDKLLQAALKELNEHGVAIIDAGGQIHKFYSPERLVSFVKGVRKLGYNVELVNLK